jgi:CubicO group peptidase (beta-lactamase class C family)
MEEIEGVAGSTARRLLAATARAQRDGRLPSLVAGVVRDGGLAWSTGRGTVGGRQPDENVQYRIGSITKSITAVLIMRLRDEGLLALGDPVDRHVPGTPFGDRTVGQLLSHMAGLRAEAPGQWWERVAGRPWPELAAQFSPDDAPHPAGRRFHYSNLGYAVLGETVARLRGRPWADAVRDEVLLPLGMVRTTLDPVPPAAAGWAVHPWADLVLPEPTPDTGAMAPAGQLWATLADLARWAAFLLGDVGDVLDPATLEEMTIPAGADPSPGVTGRSCGLGLLVLAGDGRTLVGHGGSMPGFLADVLVDRAERVGAVVLTNATSGLGPLATTLLDIMRVAEPAIVPPWSPLTDADPADLALTGTWYWGTSGYGLRLRADGMLDLVPLSGPGRSSRFRRLPDGAWLGLEGYYAGERLRAVTDDSGTVVALDLGTFIFAREPYHPGAPIPGGVDDAGWRPGPL